MLLTALAIAPGLAICFFFFYKDAHNPEPARYLLASFLLGMAAVLPAGIIEMGLFRHSLQSIPATLFTAYFVVGLVEEGCKFLMLRLYGFSRSSFDEPLDGIVYSVMVSMGFASLENAAYIWRHGYEVAFLRMFTSVPAHASFAVIMGYFVGKAKFDISGRSRLLLYAVCSSAALHGTYDAFLLLSENHWLTQHVSEVLLFSGALISLLLAVHLSRRLLRRYYRTSERLFQLPPTWAVHQATYFKLNQVHQLVEQSIREAEKWDNEPEQLLFMLKYWSTIESLRLSWKQGHRFMLIYNADVPIGFVAYTPLENGAFQLLHLFVLLHHRGRGTGRFLLLQAEAEMATKGAVIVQLNLNGYAGARSFFEKQGFNANGLNNLEIHTHLSDVLEKVLQPQRALGSVGEQVII